MPSGEYCFFFNDTATTEIYTLSLHDALPICSRGRRSTSGSAAGGSVHSRPRTAATSACVSAAGSASYRSEEHTSELQSRLHLVCRLLLGKKKTPYKHTRLSCKDHITRSRSMQ